MSSGLVLEDNVESSLSDKKAPVRGVFCDKEQLYILGKNLAQSCTNLSPISVTNNSLYFLNQNKKNRQKIVDVYSFMNFAAAQGESMLPAAQWLLDNYYVLEENFFHINQSFDSKFFDSLSVIDTKQERKIPIVLEIARLYVNHTDNMLSIENFQSIVEGFQSIKNLKIAEIWSFHAILRFALVENFAHLMDRVLHIHQMKQKANDLANQLLSLFEEEKNIEQILLKWEIYANDATFATQLLHRLREASRNTSKALFWLEKQLLKHGSDSEEIILTEHRELSLNDLKSGNIIKSLRHIEDINWEKWFEHVSQVDLYLGKKTDFLQLDFASRHQYRMAIQEIALDSGLSEYEVAQSVVLFSQDSKNYSNKEQGQNIGFFLVGLQKILFKQSLGIHPSFSFKVKKMLHSLGWGGVFTLIFGMSVLFLSGLFFLLYGSSNSLVSISIILLLLFCPVLESMFSLFSTLVFKCLPPKQLIGYDYTKSETIPKTIVVIPAIIDSKNTADLAIKILERHYWSNRREEIFFALLSDWPDSHVEIAEHDQEILAYLQEKIKKLNQSYPRRFYLLHRRRLFNAAEQCWMGWERKRGKLHELNLLLLGDKNTSFFIPDDPLPSDISYVMTIDWDTKLTQECVARLLGKIEHPLNKPCLDAEETKIIAGYCLLQPRITHAFTSPVSFFQTIFCFNKGSDPYVFAVSDLYQDLFGEGSFTGKGLYHLASMKALLKDKIPENAVLSHDLLEGSFVRTALVSDVEILEEYPTCYLVDSARRHRWIRGDWQLLPFIVQKNASLSSLSKWKMIDNLIRSLSPIFIFLSICFTTIFCSFSTAIQCLFFLIFSSFMICLIESMDQFWSQMRWANCRMQLFSIGRKYFLCMALLCLKIIFLAHQVWMTIDAIARTLYRLFISQKNLLEWRTAAEVKKSYKSRVVFYFYMMHGAVILGMLTWIIGKRYNLYQHDFYLFFAFLWMSSPILAWMISRPYVSCEKKTIKNLEKQKLRCLARKTWRYFETHVTQEHHFLPPDNVQESPSFVVAARTSPTNIGVYLLSIVAARSFGWIGLSEFLSRIQDTLATLEKMDRYKGHFYNWIDTKTLKSLSPMYISTVDSGNLVSHLMTVRQACLNLSENLSSSDPLDHSEGILDIMMILEELLSQGDQENPQAFYEEIFSSLRVIRKSLTRIQRSKLEKKIFECGNILKESLLIKKKSSDFHEKENKKFSSSLQEWSMVLESVVRAQEEDYRVQPDDRQRIQRSLLDLEKSMEKLIADTDFSFLWNKERNLFSIGFRVSSCEQDDSCYDLLASEARTTSFIAIARGDVSYTHWYKLGRPLIEIHFRTTLLSWSGSMFEYLMPSLVMKEPEGSILHQTNYAIIQEQIDYANLKQIPWGISEAAYNAIDTQMTYQYTNFGVPSLGLKRGLDENTVIAPYATLLAAQFMTKESLENIERLSKMGAIGQYGFYDAIDFTPQRIPEGKDYAIIFNYYAHHQGMSLLAMCNTILGGILRDFFHSDPMIQSAEVLLQEKAPEYIPNMQIKEQSSDISVSQTIQNQNKERGFRLIANPLCSFASLNVLSNGSWSTMISAKGSGYTKWKNIAITRWWADPSSEIYGTFIFLRDCKKNIWWSATSIPVARKNEKTETLFQESKSIFKKSVYGINAEVECVVTAEVDGEARRVTLVNTSYKDREIEITSFAELALAPEAQDAMHPAFSKMFIETKISSDRRIIYAWRHTRLGEKKVYMAHFVTDSLGVFYDVEAETDRSSFIGRSRTIKDAIVFDSQTPFKGQQGFVLDPIVALRCKVKIAPHKKVMLTFWTIVADNQKDLEDSISYLKHPDSFYRQNLLSWTQTQVETYHCNLNLLDAANAQKFAGYFIYPNPFLQISKEDILATLPKQSDLWPMSISGDFPIFVLRIMDMMDIEILVQALRFQEYLRGKDVIIDFVILNEQESSYTQDLQHRIEWHCENNRLRARKSDTTQHIFALRKDLIGHRLWKVLLATAHVVMHARNGRISDQVMRAEASMATLLKKKYNYSVKHKKALMFKNHDDGVRVSKKASDSKNLVFWNGIGGFSKEGKEYVIRLDSQTNTPAPWINVISNEQFGFHTSADGSSFTWSKNSREFALTPWSNDPVTNAPGESFYIYNKETGDIFSPFRSVFPHPDTQYECRHGQGYSMFKALHPDMKVQVKQRVDRFDPIKITKLSIHNTSKKPISLRVYAYIEWVLGHKRGRAGSKVLSWYDRTKNSFFAQNSFHTDFSQQLIFFSCNQKHESFTVDRYEFLGANGSVFSPQSVLGGMCFSNNAMQTQDPCAAASYDITLQANESIDYVFFLGDSLSQEEANALITKHVEQEFEEKLNETKREWDSFFDQVSIKTPDDSFNFMMNRWLPYQILTCRIQARAAFYQASGAFGFRDQLQDVLALLWYDPSYARKQILYAASRQFLEGDVQHWWLPLTGGGIRSKISDDIVWLAYATAEYVSATDDADILNEEVSFLDGPLLEDHQHDSYFIPRVTEKTETLYTHCVMALDLAIQRTGENGLPLILGGDWNDGMNQVGAKGKGESIWLGWFILATLKQFIPIAQEKGDEQRVKHWQTYCHNLKKTIEENFWDGAWYQRGRFDDGDFLGSKTSPECMIDSIAQSWSVLSGEADQKRAALAMESVCLHLVDDQWKMIKLFTPPFSGKLANPGYISSYPPGVRENGGQYTHAGAWVVAALAKIGKSNEAFRCFSYLNPIAHGDKQSIKRYAIEPYVTCGDVYALEGMLGRGGWSWYTGSAAWLYRAGLEFILGIKIKNKSVFIHPSIPDHWPFCSIDIQKGKGTFHIRIEKKKNIKKMKMIVDGKNIDPKKGISLSDSSVHIHIEMPWS